VYNIEHSVYIIRESECCVHAHCCVIAEFCFPRFIVAFADVNIHIFMRLLRTSDMHPNGNSSSSYLWLFYSNIAVEWSVYLQTVFLYHT
jgi:hypothetical protein